MIKERYTTLLAHLEYILQSKLMLLMRCYNGNEYVGLWHRFKHYTLLRNTTFMFPFHAHFSFTEVNLFSALMDANSISTMRNVTMLLRTL